MHIGDYKNVSFLKKLAIMFLVEVDQGEVRNVEISRVTQQLLFSKSYDFLAVFALAHSKINQIA